MRLGHLYPLVSNILILLHLGPNMCKTKLKREPHAWNMTVSDRCGLSREGPQPCFSVHGSAQTGLSSNCSNGPHFGCDTRHKSRAGNRKHVATALQETTWETIPLGHCQGFRAAWTENCFHIRRSHFLHENVTFLFFTESLASLLWGLWAEISAFLELNPVVRSWFFCTYADW